MARNLIEPVRLKLHCKFYEFYKRESTIQNQDVQTRGLLNFIEKHHSSENKARMCKFAQCILRTNRGPKLQFAANRLQYTLDICVDGSTVPWLVIARTDLMRCSASHATLMTSLVFYETQNAAAIIPRFSSLTTELSN